MIASSKGYALNFRACSGATIPEVTNLQLGALGTATTYASISVGGNDAGFSDVLTECAQPAWASNCNDAIDRAQSFINNQLPGHAACDDTEWINGLSSPVSESYHPNRLGHSSGYTRIVGAKLTGSTIAVTSRTVQEAVETADSLEAQQRTYANLDKTIRPETFRVPDLTSPRIERAAARAGVSLSSRASIDAADRRYASRQAR